MKKKIIFVADFFKDQTLGGAECDDEILINHLIQKDNYSVISVLSQDFEHFIGIDCEYENMFFIIANFIGLSQKSKDFLMSSCDYIIWEHDWKWIKNRDPSMFKGFKVPHEQIVNHDFYRKAKKVVVHSKVCQEVICSNLNILNVHNIGCALYDGERLDYLESICDTEKTTPVAVLDSNNQIKGKTQAVSHCNKNGLLPYKLIGGLQEKEFLQELSKVEKLVFLPQVLETFSRLVAEAKMLNCKVITRPKLLGFASESSFELSGRELISDFRSRTQKALQDFENIIENTKEEKEDITVILTCYRRPHLLKEQITALKNQSVPPKDIWVWKNKSEENKNLTSEDMLVLGADKTFDCDHNWKFYGRFAAAMLSETTYIALFDDDTIPGKDWLSNCLQTMEKTPGILGGTGCVLYSEGDYDHERVGWSTFNQEVKEVDLVGHAWFLKTEWLQYLWREKPLTFENGEDIHLSYTCQKYGNIKTFVPPHPKEDKEKLSSLKGYEYGIDDVATSNSRNHTVFYKQRNDIVKHSVKNGWKILRSR